MKDLTIVVRLGGIAVYRGHGYSTCDVFVAEDCNFRPHEHILNTIYDVDRDRLYDIWLELEDVCDEIALAIRKRMYDELKKEKEL